MNFTPAHVPITGSPFAIEGASIAGARARQKGTPWF